MHKTRAARDACRQACSSQRIPEQTCFSGHAGPTSPAWSLHDQQTTAPSLAVHPVMQHPHLLSLACFFLCRALTWRCYGCAGGCGLGDRQGGRGRHHQSLVRELARNPWGGVQKPNGSRWSSIDRRAPHGCNRLALRLLRCAPAVTGCCCMPADADSTVVSARSAGSRSSCTRLGRCARGATLVCPLQLLHVRWEP